MITWMERMQGEGMGKGVINVSIKIKERDETR